MQCQSPVTQSHFTAGLKTQFFCVVNA